MTTLKGFKILVLNNGNLFRSTHYARTENFCRLRGSTDAGAPEFRPKRQTAGQPGAAARTRRQRNHHLWKAKCPEGITHGPVCVAEAGRQQDELGGGEGGITCCLLYCRILKRK